MPYPHRSSLHAASYALEGRKIGQSQFRDPEGTIISLFTPLTKAARARFGTR
ncbi:hypothetical protein [Komagataeibacter europaeus]|uniref:hypothetical protein n=1 Tax=Komagataeibacter europaeus TaxID=33995 RepID=UPI002175523C|nr:hypothetical protein [Komagataeibacter europaeus]